MHGVCSDEMNLFCKLMLSVFNCGTKASREQQASDEEGERDGGEQGGKRDESRKGR